MKNALELSLYFLVGVISMQANANEGIAGIAGNIQGSFESLVSLLTSGSYLAGFVLVVSSIFKFKQHKENPTQVRLGTPLTLLGVAVGLIYLPTLLNSAGTTVFGAGGVKTSLAGVTELG